MLRTPLTAAALALAGGLGVLAVNAAGPAGAQSEFTVTAEQLRINQRISQAGVRRVNQALTRLEAVETKVNAPVPVPAAAPPAPRVVAFSVSAERPRRLGEPIPAPVAPPPGELLYGPEPVGVDRVEWQGEGTAWIVLKGSPRKCTLSVTSTEGPSLHSANVGVIGTPANTVQVSTWSPDGTPRSYSFDFVAFCPPAS